MSYIPQELKEEIRDKGRIVTEVHIVAHSIVETGGNHWDIFLQTGKDSVRLEIVPGAWPGKNGYLGRVDIIHHSYKITRRYHKRVTIPATPGHSVADFLDAVVEAGNHRYEFTQAGRGCSGWIRDQFYLFVQRGLIPSGYEREVEQAMTHAWNRNQLVGPWPVTRGTYWRGRTN